MIARTWSQPHPTSPKRCRASQLGSHLFDMNPIRSMMICGTICGSLRMRPCSRFHLLSRVSHRYCSPPVCLVPYLLAAQNTDNASGGTATLPTAITLPPSPTLTFGAPKVVLSMSGSGIEQTHTFSVSGATQKLIWSCDPKSFAIPGYNVQAVLYTADNQLQDVILNALCGTASGQSVGQTSTVHIPPGTYYLKMNSEGAWKITIIDHEHA